jgi:hypothetical protein
MAFPPASIGVDTVAGDSPSSSTAVRANPSTSSKDTSDEIAANASSVGSGCSTTCSCPVGNCSGLFKSSLAISISF